jgi:hypothetical protein
MKTIKSITEENFLEYVILTRKLRKHIMVMESLMIFNKRKGNKTGYFKNQIEIAEKNFLKYNRQVQSLYPNALI